MTEAKVYPISVAISDLKIGTSSDGRWYYSFYLHNKSKTRVLRKNQIKVWAMETNTLREETLGIHTEISAQKKMRIKNYFKHNHGAKTLMVKIYEYNSNTDVLASQEITLPGDSFKNLIKFTYVKRIESNKVKYCIKNESSYNLSSELLFSVRHSIETKTKLRTTFLLKSKNSRCGVIDLNITLTLGDMIHGVLYDLNGNHTYASSESSERYAKQLGGFEMHVPSGNQELW